jgi:hypothetical protein
MILTRSNLCSRRARAAGVAVLAASITSAALAASGCTSSSREPGGSSDAADLYGAASPSPSPGDAPSSGEPDEGPVVVPDDDIPLGEGNGETVQELYRALYAPTPEQQLVIDQAEYELVRACMAKKGFDLLDPPPKPKPAPSRTFDYDSYIGMLNPQYAQRFGYQLDPATLVPDQGSSPKDQPPDGYQEALNGDPGTDNGCVTAAERALSQGVPDTAKSTQMFGQIREKALAMTDDDPEFVAKRDEWSKCMKSKGFDYAGPKQVMERFGAFNLTPEAVDGHAPTPSSDEIATAVADAACKKETGLYLVWRAKYWGYQVELGQENQPVLEAAKNETQAMLANAQKVLAGSG